jgi:hypothetical protein
MLTTTVDDLNMDGEKLAARQDFTDPSKPDNDIFSKSPRVTKNSSDKKSFRRNDSMINLNASKSFIKSEVNQDDKGRVKPWLT